jgi:glycosyltransferase involved in cell wall biosynthesis
MRVLMLTNMYPHEADASFGTFVFEQVRALRVLGVEVDVLFVNGRQSQLNYLVGYPRLWRQLALVRYDLIHAHYVFSGLIARAQGRVPVVQSFHAPGQMETYQGWLCKRLAPHVAAVIVTSADHKRRLGYDPTHIIPCGVDLELFAPMARDQARAAVGWSGSHSVVAWVGDPRPEKRVDLAHATYQVLRQQRPDVELKVVSKVPHADIPAYLNAADVLLLTSDHEGSPVIIKEAMACNLPIVATAVGDVPEVIGNVAGCYLAEQTPADLAAKVALALDFGGRTRGREAIAHLQTGEEARRILALYQEVLGQRGAR